MTVKQFYRKYPLWFDTRNKFQDFIYLLLFIYHSALVEFWYIYSKCRQALAIKCALQKWLLYQLKCLKILQMYVYFVLQHC